MELVVEKICDLVLTLPLLLLSKTIFNLDAELRIESADLTVGSPVVA